MDALVDLPFALPTAVAGIALTALYAPNGWIGQFFHAAGIKVAYSAFGVTLALVFIGLPFVVRTVQPVLEDVEKELEEAGICFLHAPLFHPALKAVGPIRRNIGLRTFFNMLGPIVNPAQPAYQLIGVYNLEMARMYNYAMQSLGKEFTLIHSLDGYDEISLTNDTKVITNKGEFIMTPEQLGKRMVQQTDIHGGNSIEEAAKIFTKILSGEGTWAQNAVVMANAAMGLYCTGAYKTYDDAFGAAVESLESGRANGCLKKLIELQAP